MAPLIVTALSAPAAAAPRTRRGAEPRGEPITAGIPIDAHEGAAAIHAPAWLPHVSSPEFLSRHDAIVWRTHRHAAAGYGPSPSGATLASGAAASTRIDRTRPLRLGPIPLVQRTSTLGALALEAGPAWPIARRFKFRPAIDAALRIASSTRIHVAESARETLSLLSTDSRLAPVERTGGAVIDEMFKRTDPIMMVTVQLQLALL